MAATISAGDYLRMRREASGLSIQDVATMIATEETYRPSLLAHLERLERNEIVASPSWRSTLRGAFRFDVYIYRQLAGSVAVPVLCRTCGCSWADPCDDEDAGPCEWAEFDLCTHCAARAAAAATLPSPTPKGA